MEALLKSACELASKDPYYLAVEQILKSYDTSQSSTENKQMLETTYNKEQLNSVVYFTKSLESEYPEIVKRISHRKSRTKANLAHDICILINGITPMKCLKCNEDYIHTTAENVENNSYSCLICNRFSHKPCYEEEDPKPGFYFICTLCVDNYKAKSNTDQPVDTPTTQTVNPDDVEDDAKSENSSSPEEDTQLNPYQSPKSQRCNPSIEKDDEWCRLYLQGICPHGISGKGCSYTHPKRCNKYTKYGEDRWRGCRRGKYCKFYHPRLCQNSAQLKMCLTKTCKDVHLLGTQRFRPQQRSQPPTQQYQYNHSQQQQQSRRQHQRYQEGHISPWEENPRQENPISPWQESPATHSGSQRTNSEAQKNQDFLLQYLENMRADLAKTIEKKIESVLSVQKQEKKNPCQQAPQEAQTLPSPPPRTQVENPPLNQVEVQKFNQFPVNHQVPLPPFPLQNLLHPHLNPSLNPIPQFHL